MEKKDALEMIKEMVEIIPEEEIKLIKELKEYSRNKWNIAPKCLYNIVYFEEVRHIIDCNISNTDCDWKRELVEIIQYHASLRWIRNFSGNFLSYVQALPKPGVKIIKK